MTKRKEPIKPIFPLKHEFYASLDRFIHEAGMLAQAVEQLIDMPNVFRSDEAKKLLRERLTAFAESRFGDEGAPR